MTPVVRHLLPSADFVARSKAADAKAGSAIERADFDARRFQRHRSGHDAGRIHLDRDMRESLEALERRVIEARVALRFIGDYRHHSAHVPRTDAPHVQVKHGVSIVFDDVADVLGHALVRIHVVADGTVFRPLLA